MTDEIVIKAEGLTKRFGNFTATDHITFEVRKGGNIRISRRQRSRQDHSHAYAVRAVAAQRRQSYGSRI